MAEYNKPLPSPEHEDKDFWFGAKRHEFLLKKCKGCGAYTWYTNPMCADCHSMDFEWVKSPGRGTVFTYNIAYRSFTPGFTEEDVPYINVLVDLEEGTRYCANLCDCKPEDVKIGMPVEIFFDDVTDEVTLPKFRPAKA
jgi:uncharacterized OB-fold protein